MAGEKSVPSRCFKVVNTKNRIFSRLNSPRSMTTSPHRELPQNNLGKRIWPCRLDRYLLLPPPSISWCLEQGERNVRLAPPVCVPLTSPIPARDPQSQPAIQLSLTFVLFTHSYWQPVESVLGKGWHFGDKGQLYLHLVEKMTHRVGGLW